MSQRETIVAIATAPGQGGVGIVRMSGPLAHSILKKLWTSRDNSVGNLETHRLYYGKIADDPALIVWMKAPHSYTGEDVVEIQAHGSRLLLEKIVALCLKEGAKPAGPGEFTERAYLNGKLDLAQAEAVADVIAASSEAGLKIAQEQLLELRAFVEAAIDFPEEEIEMIRAAQIAERLAPIQQRVRALIESYAIGKTYRDGVTVVLAGKPNSGKSSLLNALLGIDRAIVHHEPGTTRDVIEESVQWKGFLFRLIDTAGVRESDHPVEAMGVARAHEWIEKADIVLWLVDGSEQEPEVPTVDPKTIILVNKSDLAQKLRSDFCSFLQVSAKTGEGLDHLRQRLVQHIRQKNSQEGEGVVITKMRHKEALDNSDLALSKAQKTLENGLSSEFVAQHLKEANQALGTIIGEVSTENLLDTIFSKFCIGK